MSTMISPKNAILDRMKWDPHSTWWHMLPHRVNTRSNAAMKKGGQP
jgi:hypothetical protein